MPKLLRTGLILLGCGLLSGCGMFLFRWGPCGPSSIWGLVCLLAAGVCLLLGCLFSVTSLLQFFLRRLQQGVS